jgi:7-cyano-7-deazaguanine synthase
MLADVSKRSRYEAEPARSPQAMKIPNCVAIVSGGLDSITMVYHLISLGYTPHMISFDYGQRHKTELIYAYRISKQLLLPHNVLHLRAITPFVSNSALTSLASGDYVGEDGKPFTHKGIEIPEGHYAEESMKATVVPNRNMMMIAIAGAIAVNYRYRTVAIGVHSGDHFIYPDCRPGFIEAMNTALLLGNEGFSAFEGGFAERPRPAGWNEGIEDFATLDDLPAAGNVGPGALFAPFLHYSKTDIAYRALELGVPLHLTWSCYKGEDKHCGRCGTCVERLEAIDGAIKRLLGLPQEEYDRLYEMNWRPGQAFDMTEYEDEEYWRVVVHDRERNVDN